MTFGSIETVVFDLDGTLVDTSPDLTAALNAVLTSQGRPPIPELEVRHLVGRGARALIEQGMAETGPPAPDAAIPGLMQQFLDHYSDNIAAGSQAFPGAEAAVKRLIAHGVRVGICTNKPYDLTVKLMDALDLQRFFPVMLGADSQPYRKPDPRHLFDTIAKLGGHASRAVLIGDSETDLKTARAANVPIILVSFGYTEIPVHEMRPDAVIDSYDQLDAALTRLGRA